VVLIDQQFVLLLNALADVLAASCLCEAPLVTTSIFLGPLDVFKPAI